MDAWHSYIDPLTDRVRELQPEMKGSAALEDLERELETCTKYLGREFGYQFFCCPERSLRKPLTFQARRSLLLICTNYLTFFIGGVR